MSHLLTRSYKTRDGKETLFDKRGRTMGKYESITDADRAAKLISETTEARPRRKPMHKGDGKMDENNYGKKRKYPEVSKNKGDSMNGFVEVVRSLKGDKDRSKNFWLRKGGMNWGGYRGSNKGE
jgi:hypothetical protein